MDNKESFQENTWVGKKLGKYQVTRLLGCGGMGAVYQAFHILLEKIVCLKILFPSLIQPGKKMVERFLREAKAIASLQHPNIVAIYDIEKENDIYFIVMEYIAGKTLNQLLEEKDAFTIHEAIDIAIETAKALGSAHRQHIIHRDVKPANIMVTEDGKVKLTDFGLATSTDISGKISGSNEIWGTPIYLSPEYIKGEAIDGRSDIYSLGVMLFHMLTGEPPYTGRNPISIIHQHIEAQIPSIRGIREDVPIELDEIVAKAMAKKVEDRYTTAEEMAEALRHCSSKLIEDSHPTTEKYSPNHEFKKLEPEDIGDTSAAKIRLLIVDDSPTMCKALMRIVREDPSIDVVAVAHNGEEALNLIPKSDPQVITLDYNMAVMDGSTTLKYIMARYPRPVIMLSAFTYEGALTSFECLSYGAVDFIWKTSKSHRNEFKNDLLSKIRGAAQMELIVQTKPRISKSFGVGAKGKCEPAQWIVVMVSGEGGYHTYLKIIPYLPKNIPCALIIVHEMPNELTGSFCNYLNDYSKIIVKEVKEEEVISEGVCYITNHLSQLCIKKDAQQCCTINMGKKSSGESVFSQILSSVVGEYGHKVIGVVLTGNTPNMTRGLHQLKEAGGIVLAQNPDNCLNRQNVCTVIQQKMADKIVKDVDIPSVIWYLLKRTQKKPKE